MAEDPDLISALWRSWYFKGAPEQDLEVSSLFLARLFTAAAILALPLIGYFSVYLNFNPLAVFFPVLIMVGVLLSKESVAISPTVRLDIIVVALYLDSIMSLVRHDSVAAGMAALLCASHILVLSHGFRVATGAGAAMLMVFLAILNVTSVEVGAVENAFNTLSGLLWLLVMNLLVATVYGAGVSLRSALSSTNERLVLKLQGLQGVIASAADQQTEVDAAVSTAPQSPVRRALGASSGSKKSTEASIEMFAWEDLFARIGRSVESLEPPCQAKVHFINETSDDEAYLADASRLSGVISRMVMNACSRQQADNVWITTSASALQAHRHTLSLKIEDDGVPLCEDQISILDLDDALPAKSLPLTSDIHLILVGRWLHELGIKPELEQSPTGGASIALEFTADVLSRSAMHAPNIDANEAPRAASVLIVDDDATIRRSIQMLLKKEFGVEVATASSGMEALRTLGKTPVDMVITDYFMPGMDGAEMIRLLREAGDDTPVVAITTAGMGDDQDKLWLAGADVVLPKPFTSISLTHLVQRYVYA